MNTQEIQVRLTVDELNVVLKALGALPFSEVYAIIHKIHQQATDQSANEENTGA